MSKDPECSDSRTPFQKMADLAAKLINIPKEEVDRREKEWKEARKGEPSPTSTVDQH